MDKDIEMKIISAFIIKRKKTRAAYELCNNKKRNDFIWRIGHYNHFDNRFIHKITQPVNSYKVIYDILKKYNAPDECYVLSYNDSIDGKIALLEDALKEVVFWGPGLISCIHGKLAYFEEEVTGGPAPERYLLINNN